MRRVSIFGATGSVGQNTIDLIVRTPGNYRVVALTGGHNIAQLARDAIALAAEVAVTAHEALLDDLRDALKGSGVEAAAGPAALIEAAARPTDWAMSAIVGAAGLAPGLTVLQQGGTLALANKESLVCAGPLMLRTAAQHGARLLPVDSEHSAVFQALVGEDRHSVEHVTITSSGGAFRDWPLHQLADVTVQQASCHPNFAMGQRITIDSASMFNKSLEIIEAKELFGLEPDQIKVLIQPEQIIHAIVAYKDGGWMAHMGAPDMRHAIGYALHWPDRRYLPVERVDLAEIGTLSFKKPDEKRYPSLRLAREVMAVGGLAGAVFNGAKERALDAFIDGRIGFLQMAEVVERVLDDLCARSGLIDATMTLDIVVQTDHLAREQADAVISQITD